LAGYGYVLCIVPVSITKLAKRVNLGWALCVFVCRCRVLQNADRSKKLNAVVSQTGRVVSQTGKAVGTSAPTSCCFSLLHCDGP